MSHNQTAGAGLDTGSDVLGMGRCGFNLCGCMHAGAFSKLDKTMGVGSGTVGVVQVKSRHPHMALVQT